MTLVNAGMTTSIKNNSNVDSYTSINSNIRVTRNNFTKIVDNADSNAHIISNTDNIDTNSMMDMNTETSIHINTNTNAHTNTNTKADTATNSFISACVTIGIHVNNIMLVPVLIAIANTNRNVGNSFGKHDSKPSSTQS